MSRHYRYVWQDGGEEARAHAAPLDMTHLSRQTLGDKHIEKEVLAMFLRQMEVVSGQIATADPAGRRELAHALTGAARGIGAFALADCAAALEADPGDEAEVERLSNLAAEVHDFIAELP